MAQDWLHETRSDDPYGLQLVAREFVAAEAELARLREALRAIASEVHGREKIPNIYEFARAALASQGANVAQEPEDYLTQEERA